MAEQHGHATVLLDEAVAALVTDPDGFYIDGTFGRGGHSGAILDRLSAAGRLLAIDKDPEAEQVAAEKFGADPRFAFHRGSFAALGDIVEQRVGRGAVSGVLLDLGVSSPQLDQAERGFSFSQDGPLDMRMDPDSGISAAEWLARAEQKEIADVLWQYGEEKFSRRMAAAVVRARSAGAITRTGELAKIIAEANPAWEKGKHPATRAFQAIRIFINRELGDLEDALAAVVDSLADGGRRVVISFHTLEDRIVKRFIRLHEKGPVLPRGLPVREEDIYRPLRSVGKAVKPARAETEVNVRARSAVMRVAEKVAGGGVQS